MRSHRCPTSRGLVVWLGWIDDVLQLTDCSRGFTLRSVLLALDLLGR
jgi:hypothetical protein